MPDDRDCENNKVKTAAEICLVFFRSLEVTSSTPADEETFSFSISDAMPSAEKFIAGIIDMIGVGHSGRGASGSAVKMDEKPVLNIYLHNTAGPVKGPSRRDIFTKLVIRTTEDQEHEKREE